jgi:autotransporter-associated beta strand protein
MKSRSYFFHRSALMSSCAVLAFAGASHQAQAQTTYQWNGSPTASSDWTTTANWSAPGIGVSNASFNARLNVYNGSGQALTYSSAQGTTVYANAGGRGLVISRASPTAAGSMNITGGSFSTLGSTQADVIGNNATGSLTISGTGSFIGSAAGTIVGLNSGGGTSTFTISGTGSATVATLQLSAATTLVNLDGGTLTANQIVDVDDSGVIANSNTTFNFNGGTLTAGSGSITAFMTGLTNAYVKSGGAKIDTSGRDITIGQALLADSSAGGLQKDGLGILTLANVSTYTGDTLVNNGSLALTSAGGLKFKIGADDVNNKITGAGTVSLDGLFTFDLTTASTTLNDSWNIVNVASLTESYGSNFNVDTFSREGGGTGSGIWTKVIDANSSYQFDTSSGVLTVIPEPSAALLGGLGLLVLLRRRR